MKKIADLFAKRFEGLKARIGEWLGRSTRSGRIVQNAAIYEPGDDVMCAACGAMSIGYDRQKFLIVGGEFRCVECAGKGARRDEHSSVSTAGNPAESTAASKMESASGDGDAAKPGTARQLFTKAVKPEET